MNLFIILINYNMDNNLFICKTDNMWVEYYNLAEKDIDGHFKNIYNNYINDVNFECVMDLACGKGRNSLYLSKYTNDLYCVDINEYAINLAKENLKNIDNCNITFIQNNGTKIPEIPDNKLTFIYQFDSGVHFSKEVIREYLFEFYRILKPGGTGFFHHSNYGNILDNKDKSNFQNNPHWRTDMTKELFNTYCQESGLVCYRQ